MRPIASSTENAHSPVLFPNSPVARIVFIPSQSNKRWSEYDGKFSIHCGAVDSLGRVHNYCGRRGLRTDEVGWADALIINLATVLNSLKIQSRMWDIAIHECSENLLRGHSADLHLHTDEERFDCLDFLVDIVRQLVPGTRIDRLELSGLLANKLTYLT
ncbi:hypothetical protein CRM22_011421 [Opisthorchis felineus]|uniref:MKRN2 opposite strand protein-like C-terminal domain-containing protein n=1 Tax=Opisthorchis felineus TaxID=147828 RepID=A0A4S2JCT1_OPIFE|nr:hypothetical protein CRM22_011421 [Opisthorchis felineus]